MDLYLAAAFAVTGCVVGIAGGMLGIGGGVLVIPALTILFHFGHKQAVGTSLGMLLPPIGIFAFLAYQRSGDVNIKASALLAAGFAVGAFLGAWLASTGRIPESALRRGFALFLLYYAGTLLLKSDRQAWGAARGLALAAAGAAALFAFKALGRRLEPRPSLREIYAEQSRVAPPQDYEI